MSECKYSHLQNGDAVTIDVTGTVTCMGCGNTWSGFSFDAFYIGHSISGSAMADAFEVKSGVICSECGIISYQYQEACGGSYALPSVSRKLELEK